MFHLKQPLIPHPQGPDKNSPIYLKGAIKQPNKGHRYPIVFLF